MAHFYTAFDTNGASFIAATNPVINTVTSTITGTLNGVSKQATLTVLPGFTTSPGILADASVLAGANSSRNYGQQPALITETDANSGTDTTAVTYLKFDLTNTRIAPTSATLKLTVNGLSAPANGMARVRVYGVADTTWTEAGILWFNAPSLDRAHVGSGGRLLTTQDVPLSGGIAAFDVTGYVVGHLGKQITFQILNDAPDGQRLGVNSKEAADGHPTLLLTSSFLNDVPAPLWALNVIPTDSSPSGGGPSSSDSVNLASGVEENTPGPDIAGRNPIGPSAGFSRLYRSVLAANGYASPGLSPGWTHNYDIRVQGAQGAWIPLTLTYPNGAKEQWGPELGENNVPTGTLYPLGSMGTPYLVHGIPSPSTTGRWLSLTITYKDHTSWTFTPDPRTSDNYLLTRLSNPVGHSVYIVYDEAGRLVKATDDSSPAKILLSFQYSGGYLASITEPFGRTVNFTFAQAAGGTCLVGVSRLNSSALQWQYDYTPVNGWPLLSSVGAPDPTTVPTQGGAVPMLTHPITYYPDGRVATMVDANGNRRLYTYEGGAQVQVYSPNGSLVDHWTQASGSLNNATGYTDANNASNQVLYEDPANPYCPTKYTSKSAAHPQVISATYDQYGNTLTTGVACNGGTAMTFYNYVYSAFPLGMLSSVNQGGMPGNVSYTYYPNGLVQTVTVPSPSGGAGAAMNCTTTYYYTALGNISTITKPGPNTTGQLVAYRYDYVYDPLDGTRQSETLGQPLTVTDPSGAVTHYRYDVRGNRTAVIDALGNRVDAVYNIADQLVSTLSPATGQTGTGRPHVDIAYQYLGGPAIATTAYDESGAAVHRAAQTTGKEGEALAQTGNVEQASYKYDAQQRLTSLKDGNGNGFAHTYDAVGNLTQLTYPSGTSVHSQFDVDGNVKTFTNARGQSTQANLIPNDPLLQSLQHADGRLEQFTYDIIGRTTQVSDGFTTLDYTYDVVGNIVAATTTYATPNVLPVTISYGYYADGSRATMNFDVYGNGVSYTYDLCGRLTDVGNAWQHSAYHYDYDALGHLIHKSSGAGETTYQYNALSQLVGLTNFDVRQNVISDYSALRYDGAGNLLQMTVTVPPLDRNGPLTSGTVTYTYDSQDRLTRELSRRNLTQIAGGPNIMANYDYASASDAADNLTLLRGVAQSSNADNQIVSDANNGGAYAYDADGNPTLEEGVNLQYDDEGHLTAYDDNANGRHLRMGYRPDGLRAWKKAGNGPATYFFYDGDRLAFEVTPSTDPRPPFVQTYGWGASGLEEVNYSDPHGNLTLFYFFDPQGNVVSHAPVSDTFLDVTCYDAFGQLIGDWIYHDLPNWPLWTGLEGMGGWGGQWGAYTDIVSRGPGQMGLILLTHRYYNPDTGRFLTRDPIGYEGGVNVYAYTRNNPVNRNDPSGLDYFLGWSSDDWKGAGMAIWDELSPLIPGYGLANTFGHMNQFKYNLQMGNRGWSGYEDMHNYLGIASILSMHPDYEAFLAGFKAKPTSSPCFIAGTTVQVPATEERGGLVANKDIASPEGVNPPLSGLPVTTKLIEQIQTGNLVVTRNPETGQTEFKRVVATKVRTTQTLLVLALADRATGKVVETLTTTPQHPFNVAGKGFTAAINLALGNAIVTRAGPPLIVQLITPCKIAFKMNGDSVSK